MPEVAVKLTPWTRRELLLAYSEAWVEVIRTPPSRACLALLSAQSTVECGHDGRPGCFNHNVSNIMAFEKSWPGAYHVLRGAPECADPDKLPTGAIIPNSTWIVCPHDMIAYLPAGGSWFRAYPDFRTACVDKIRVLDRNWPRAIVVLSRATGPADADALALALVGPPRYYSASSSPYANGLGSISKKIIEGTPEMHWPPIAGVPSTLPAPAPDASPVTQPQTSTSKSSQRIPAVREPIADLSLDSPATPLRAGEGEHTVEPEDPEL